MPSQELKRAIDLQQSLLSEFGAAPDSRGVSRDL